MVNSPFHASNFWDLSHEVFREIFPMIDVLFFREKSNIPNVFIIFHG